MLMQQPLMELVLHFCTAGSCRGLGRGRESSVIRQAGAAPTLVALKTMCDHVEDFKAVGELLGK